MLSFLFSVFITVRRFSTSNPSVHDSNDLGSSSFRISMICKLILYLIIFHKSVLNTAEHEQPLTAADHSFDRLSGRSWFTPERLFIRHTHTINYLTSYVLDDLTYPGHYQGTEARLGPKRRRTAAVVATRAKNRGPGRRNHVCACLPRKPTNFLGVCAAPKSRYRTRSPTLSPPLPPKN